MRIISTSLPECPPARVFGAKNMIPDEITMLAGSNWLAVDAGNQFILIQTDRNGPQGLARQMDFDEDIGLGLLLSSSQLGHLEVL